jgi:cobalamin biosynthesis Mg chelatase CobN
MLRAYLHNQLEQDSKSEGDVVVAGLYKQLSELQNLLAAYREDPANNESLREPIVDMLASSGLDKDCPYEDQSGTAQQLDTDNVAAVPAEQFSAYVDRVYRCVGQASWLPHFRCFVLCAQVT